MRRELGSRLFFWLISTGEESGLAGPLFLFVAKIVEGRGKAGVGDGKAGSARRRKARAKASNVFPPIAKCAMGGAASGSGAARVTDKNVRATPLGKQTSKRRGELAELEFMAKATRLGFRVSRPYGESDRYDFIVDTGERLVRVQVKSSSHLIEHEGVYFIASQRCSNGKAIPYQVGEIDYLAVYVFPEDAWFIIPVEAFVPRTSVHLFPRERAGDGRYAQYREAWWLLGRTGR